MFPASPLQGKEDDFNLPKETRRGNDHKPGTVKVTGVQERQESCALSGLPQRALVKVCQAAGSRKEDSQRVAIVTLLA